MQTHQNITKIERKKYEEQQIGKRENDEKVKRSKIKLNTNSTTTQARKNNYLKNNTEIVKKRVGEY